MVGGVRTFSTEATEKSESLESYGEYDSDLALAPKLTSFRIFYCFLFLLTQPPQREPTEPFFPTTATAQISSPYKKKHQSPFSDYCNHKK